MTTDQRQHFYFPAWRMCAKALGWTMAKGRLVADLDGQRAEAIASPAREERLKVLDLAEQFARQAHRAVHADDLRHACNYVASAGKTASTGAMDNHATTMAVRLFALLADPDDLQAVGDWLNPEEADRRDYAAWMKRLAPEATLIAIARNAWDTTDWEAQDMPRLRWLARQVKEQSQRRGAAFRRSAEIDPEVSPF